MKLGKALPILALVGLVPAVLFAIPPEAPGYKVVKRVEVGGEGGWDYLTVVAASSTVALAVRPLNAKTLLLAGS